MSGHLTSGSSSGRGMCSIPEQDPDNPMIRSAIRKTVASSGLPMLTGPPRPLAATARMPRTVSFTWHSDRVWLPSPATVSGRPSSAWQANVGTTRPSPGRMPGP